MYKLKILMCVYKLGKKLNVLRVSFKRNLYHSHFSNGLYHSLFRLYPIKRTDNAESASSPSNYIPRTQSHLNIAEFGGDKHGAHVPGSHSLGEEKCGISMLLAREDDFRRFNTALNDADLTIRWEAAS